MKKLESSKLYSLYELLYSNIENNGKIVIPDLQRDYCWGYNESLITSFFQNLHEQYCKSRNSEVIMGLLYGYYESTRPNLLLCDGQQRITTLYLLIGMLYRYVNIEEHVLRELLMSSFEEEKDDFETRLLYDIRESSKYFLSELVKYFFFDKQSKIEDNFDVKIAWAKWWKLHYELDPTIKCIRETIKKIHNFISEISDLSDFIDYISYNLKFIFYDMNNRKSGEETFVLINTSGEPLTPSENLKPILLCRYNESEMDGKAATWEIIDKWFWKNRQKGLEDTSEYGMNEFLRRVSAIYDKNNNNYYRILVKNDKNDKNNVQLSFCIQDPIDKMEKCFTAYKRIYDDQELINECQLSQSPLSKRLDLKEYFVILPTLYYIIRYPNADNLNIVRVFKFFKNLSNYTAVNQENDNIRLALYAIEQLPNQDIISWLSVSDLLNKSYVLTEEEEVKLTILQSEKDLSKRKIFEEAFWKLQFENKSSGVWSGRIGIVIKWAYSDSGFDVDIFEKYSLILDTLFSNYDNLRKLFITQDFDEFPIKISGGHHCFADNNEEFHKVINNNVTKFKELVFKFLGCNTSSEIEQSIRNQIEHFDHTKNWSEFVKFPYLLEYTDHKHIYYNDQRGWILCKKTYGRPLSVFNAHLLHVLGGSINEIKRIPDYPNWIIHYFAKSNAVDYIRLINSEISIEIDVYQTIRNWEIRVFKTDNTPLNSNMDNFTPMDDNPLIFYRIFELQNNIHNFTDISSKIKDHLLLLEATKNKIAEQ